VLVGVLVLVLDIPLLYRPDGTVTNRHPVLVHERRVDLPFRRPLFPDNLFGHLVATAVPGVEEWRGGAYRRTLRLTGGPAVIALSPPATPDSGSLAARIWLAEPGDEAGAVAVCRRILDLDADPGAVDARLGADPVLAPLVAAAPGRRVPGAADPAELAVRAVLGQQVSTAAAATHAGRLVRAHGVPVDDPDGGLSHLFPDAEALAGLDPETLALPQSRRRTLVELVEAVASGRLDLSPDCDPVAVRAGLAALPGIGRWTVETVAMRALADPDAFLPTDLGIVLAARALGLPSTPAALTARAQVWRPYRAYAVQHLWATGTHPVNRLPG
jgi:AraC family transcriptional regulator of adaptative response / DNA-3-methyladenine glycosylase II